MEVVPGGIKEQMEQVMKNLTAVVQGSGSNLGQVVKTTVSGDLSILRMIQHDSQHTLLPPYTPHTIMCTGFPEIHE
jgi:hypothetical protein